MTSKTKKPKPRAMQAINSRITNLRGFDDYNELYDRMREEEGKDEKREKNGKVKNGKNGKG